ncbi:MAG: two-component system sensor histidine kinase NtrB, partial [Spirochaetota bacterium]
IPLGYILSIFSVINYFFNIPFPWFGLFLGVFTAFMVILVFRFHLIDIKRLVNGILFYPSIIAILVFIYISFILQNQQELSRMFGLPEGVTLVLEVIIIYLAVSTLRKLFDLTYFKKRFPHLLASRFGNIEPLEYLSYSMTIKGLFSRLREVFRAHHKVDTIMVLLLNREKDVFEPVEKSPSFHIKNSGELARVVAKFNRGVTLEELLIYLNHRDEVELLHRYGVNLVLPVKRADEVIALILMPRPSIISSWSYQDITALNYIRYILPPLIDRCQMYENEKEIEKHQYRMEQLVVMGEMSSGLAHEIRNPLSIISTSVETILNRDCPAEDRNKMLRYIQEETTRINILVNKLLSINFQKKPEFEEVDLVYIFNRLKSFLKYELKDKNINFYIHNTQPLGIYSDPNMLFQIFLNLALNSIEALNGGGTISIDYIRRNNSVEIMVKDDGPGIPRELQQKVFDPFFTTKKKGSGLGLTVTRKLIENLFGDIRLLASGDGTCFKITFPILKRGREGESI